jgi:hypothetical protein
MSPKKMKRMLKSMGIDIDEFEGVTEVIIRSADKEILITNPSVAIMEAHGNKTFQISGDVQEEDPVPGRARPGRSRSFTPMGFLTPISRLWLPRLELTGTMPRLRS